MRVDQIKVLDEIFVELGSTEDGFTNTDVSEAYRSKCCGQIIPPGPVETHIKMKLGTKAIVEDPKRKGRYFLRIWWEKMHSERRRRKHRNEDDLHIIININLSRIEKMDEKKIFEHINGILNLAGEFAMAEYDKV